MAKLMNVGNLLINLEEVAYIEPINAGYEKDYAVYFKRNMRSFFISKEQFDTLLRGLKS